MKPPKLGLIILTLSLVFAGTYLVANIFKRPGKPTTTQQLPSIKLSSLKPEPLSSENFDGKNNLTKALGQNLFEQIQTDNLIDKEKKNLPADINSLSEKLTNNIISEGLSDFKLVTTIYDSEIKISQDISKEAKTQYLKTLGEINQKDFSGFNKNYLEIIVDVYQKIDSSSANRLANIYKNLAADYLNLAVPTDWVDVHKTLIIYAKNAEIVYRAMANYPVDPIKGYLALETVDSLVSGAGEIQNILQEKLKEIGS